MRGKGGCEGSQETAAWRIDGKESGKGCNGEDMVGGERGAAVRVHWVSAPQHALPMHTRSVSVCLSLRSMRGTQGPLLFIRTLFVNLLE